MTQKATYTNYLTDSLALQKYKAQECYIIPVILRPVMWQNEPFADLQVLPVNAKPVITWNHKDEAFLQIVQGIEEAIQNIRRALPSLINEKRSSSLLGNDPIGKNGLLSLHGRELENAETNIKECDNQKILQDADTNRDTGNGSTITIQDILSTWPNVLSQLKKYNLSLVAHLEYCSFIQIHNESPYLVLTMQTKTHTSYQYLNQEHHLADLVIVLQNSFNCSFRIQLVKPDDVLN